MQWMECAILYESGFNHLVDYVIAVTAPTELRIQRIMHRDLINRESAIAWIDKQWPQSELQKRANYEIINDGRELEPQIEYIINHIKE